MELRLRLARSIVIRVAVQCMLLFAPPLFAGDDDLKSTDLTTVDIYTKSNAEWRDFAGQWQSQKKPRLTVRYQGHDARLVFHGSQSTRQNATKMAFRLSWPDRFGTTQRLIFKAGYFDPTRIREWLGLQMFSVAGITTPESNLVRLRINDRVVGIYVMIKAVDAAYLARHFGSEALANDLLYYGDPPHSRFAALTDLSPLPKTATPAEIYTAVVTQADPAGEKLARMIQELNQPALDIERLARQIDLPQWARWFAVSELMENWDSPWQRRGNNYSLYRPAKGRWQILPWDPDHIFENRGYYFPQSQMKGIQKLLMQDSFTLQKKFEVQKLAQSVLQPKKLYRWIDRATQLLEPVVAAGQESGVTLTQWRDDIKQLKNNIAQRYRRLLSEVCKDLPPRADRNKANLTLGAIGAKPDCQ